MERKKNKPKSEDSRMTERNGFVLDELIFKEIEGERVEHTPTILTCSIFWVAFSWRGL